MGSPFNIIFYCNDSSRAIELSRQCFALIDSLNNIFSDYSISSEVGKLALDSSYSKIKVSDELFRMILQSKQAWKKSGKTFDVTIGSLTQLWRKAKRENRFPTETEISNAKKLTGFENIVIDETLKTISFKKPGIRLDFGGIVKGYAAQRVIDFLKIKDVTAALVDAGGDIAISNSPPGKSGWVVGINLPAI
jgi:thiamine biosynthesis lipoprotein